MTIKHLYPDAWPTLNLDFANELALDPRITFSRSSIGTYTDKNGIIQYAAEDEPRFDYDPVTGESLGLLIEESRTNIIPNSLCSVSTGWSFGTHAVTDNAGTAPDGTTTATLVTPNSGSYNTTSPQRILPTAGAYTNSVFVKPDGITEFKLNFLNYAETLNQSVAFDTTQSGIDGAGITPDINNTENYLGATMKHYPNGWVRLSISVNIVGPNLNGSIQFKATGDGVNSFYVWHWQTENGSFPSSLIPTTGAVGGEDRDPDTATVDTTGLYGDEFTIITEPFGVASGGNPLSLYGVHNKRTSVYPRYLPQEQINTVAKVGDFWMWRVLGSSFALEDYSTNGQVTVDWGDGTIEVLTTAEHTFTNGSGYHDIGFRLDSGTYFGPHIGEGFGNEIRLIATGPAPESMGLDMTRAYNNCPNLVAFDGTIAVSKSGFIAWQNCRRLQSFPFIDTSAANNFKQGWTNCVGLTTFPLLDTSSVTQFGNAWSGCSGLTSFPKINTSSGTGFSYCWDGCTSLADFPANFFNTTGTITSANAFEKTFRNCALTAQSIENILVSLDTNGLSGTFTLDINQGTNAAQSSWSTAANTALANLQTKGWTVNYNP
jgi:hypothetical protein